MSRMVLVAFVLGCGGSHPSSPAVGAAPAVVKTSPSDAAPVAPSTAVAPTPVAPAPVVAAAPVSALPAACRGTNLDLAELARRHACDSKHDATKLPAAITRTIDPAAIVVAAGQQASAMMVLTNTSPTDVDLYLEGCGFDEISTSLEADGKSGDGDPECEVGGACGGTVAISLVAGGTARVPFVLDARKRKVGQDCKVTRTGSVKRGKYQLTVSSWAGVWHGQVTVK